MKEKTTVEVAPDGTIITVEQREWPLPPQRQEIIGLLVEAPDRLPDPLKRLLQEEHNWKTLVILGNGFDVMHNLPTSYCDFKKYLMQDRNDPLAERRRNLRDFLLSTCFDQNKLWSDFERTLGQPNFKELLEFFLRQANKDEIDRWLFFIMLVYGHVDIYKIL